MSDKPQKNSLLCPNCRKLISRSVPACPFCGLRHPASRWKNSLLLAGITDSDHLVKVLITVNVLMFGLSLLIDPRSSALSASPFHMLSPSSQSLFILGSTGTVPLFHLDRWWTLIAAGFLHGGLLHLVFNMLALRQLTPLVCMEYGISRTIAIYSLGNIAGFFLSGLAGVNFTIGASAAVCSLIGAMLYYGKSRGGIYGQMVFRQIGGWAVGIALFGFLVPGINNWGHGGGMLAGALLALLLGYRERRSEQFSHRVLAVLCIAVTALVLAWSCLNGLLFLLLQ